MASDAAAFFFDEGVSYRSLMEVRLKDGDGKSIGNIDMVVVSHDDQGQVLDFGSVEIQAVYISGNIRNPFMWYMNDAPGRASKDWTGANYPRPDYLSSSRKRLIPQLDYKGRLFNQWGKQVVVIHQGFFETLPTLDEVDEEEADLLWLVYDLEEVADHEQLQLTLARRICTRWARALDTVSSPSPAPIDDFTDALQVKLDRVLGTR